MQAEGSGDEGGRSGTGRVTRPGRQGPCPEAPSGATVGVTVPCRVGWVNEPRVGEDIGGMANVPSRWIDGSTSFPKLQRDFICLPRAYSSMAEQEREPGNPILHIYTDGAAGPTNPGPAASAWIIMNPASGEVLVKDAVYIGRQTNNVAEYTAIIKALDDCMSQNRGKVRVHSDSQLCINQINGSWRVKKPHLRPMLAQVHRLRAEFEDIRFVWVSRGNGWISECDRNANEVLAEHQSGKREP